MSAHRAINPPSFPRLRAPAVIAAIWTAVAIVAAVQAVALVRLDGRADLLGSIASRLSIIPLWALATPFILRSARALPVIGVDWRPNPAAILAHVALGSAFIVVTNLLIRLPMVFAGASNGGGLDALVRSTLQGVAEYFPPALVVYGVIVAVGHVFPRGLVAAPHASPRGPSREALTRETSETIVDAADVQVAGATVADAQPLADLPAPGAENHTPSPSSDSHLTVRQWNRVHLVRLDEIDWVEAQDNYIVVHASSRAYKGRERISDVESQLDARRFVRIHRSTIVQIGKIREVQPLTHGDHAVILRDGTVLRVARSRRQALGEALGLEL